MTSTYTPSEVEDFMKQGRIVNGYLHSDESDDVRFLGSAYIYHMMVVAGEELQHFIGVVFGLMTLSSSETGLIEVIPELGAAPTDSTQFVLYGG